MIRCIFFDIGNILLNEDPLSFANFRTHVRAIQDVRPDISFARLLAEREERARAGSAWPLYEIVSRYLDQEGCARVWTEAEREIRARYDELSPPIAGADNLIRALAPRFRLGVIANQGKECRRWLDQLGWLDRFEVVALSEEEGVYKPDPCLFQIALDRAGVEPSEAIMVGDRLDNDIAPATSLGMATAWVRWPRPADKGWCPPRPDEAAFARSLERIAAETADRPGRVVPTLAVDNLRELVPALLSLPTRS